MGSSMSLGFILLLCSFDITIILGFPVSLFSSWPFLTVSGYRLHLM